MRTLWAVLVAVVIGFAAQAQQRYNNLTVLTNLQVGQTLNGVDINGILTNSAATKLDITNGTAVNLLVNGTLTYDLSDESLLAFGNDYGIGLDVGLSSTTAKARLRSVSTLADLVAADPLASDLFSYVNVLGHSEAGDGGGGEFRRVLASSGTNNGGTFFTSTFNATYAWERVWDGGMINAKWFGLFPDDGADDYSAWVGLRSFLTNAGGGQVMFPAGIYNFSNTVSIPRKTKMFGEGQLTYANVNSTTPGTTNYLAMGRTAFYLNNSANVPLVTFDPSGGPQFHNNQVISDGSTNSTFYVNSSLTDVLLVGNRANNSAAQSLIYLENTWCASLTRVGVVNYSGYAIYLRNCNVAVVDALYGAGDGGGLGIMLDDSADCQIRNCQFGGADGPALWINTATGHKNLISDNMFFNSVNDTGLAVTGISADTITTASGHKFQSGDPVLWSAGTGTLPSQVAEGICYFAANVTASTLQIHTNRVMAINGGYLPLTSGSGTYYVTQGPSVGLYILRGSENTIVGNRFDQHYSDGVLLDGAQRNTIAGNSLSENGFGTTNVAAGAHLVRSATGNTIVGNNGVTQDYGIWADATTSANQWDTTSLKGTADVYDLSAANTPAVTFAAGYAVRAASLVATNTITAGTSSSGTVLTLNGGTAGATQLSFDRSSLANSHMGFSTSTDQIFAKSLSRSITLWTIFGDTANSIMTLGDSSARAAPMSGLLRGEDASGTDVSGATLSIRGGRSTGSATPSRVLFRTTTTGSTGTTAQTLVDALDVIGRSTTPLVSMYGDAYVSGVIDLGHASANTLTATNGVLYVEGVQIATKPATETLTYSSTTVTLTAGKGPNQSSVLTCTNNFTLTFSGVTDNDGGTIWVHPAATNCTVTLSSPAYGPTGTTLTITGGTGSTNHTVLAWKATTVNSTNVVNVNALNYYR